MGTESRPFSRRLPVIPLRQTLDKYLKSVVPFLRDDEAQGGPSCEEEMQKRIQWAKEFEDGIGGVLQRRLVDLDNISPYNWLDDNFWIKAAYHSSRTSLVINSNWWCMLQSDPSIPAIPTPKHGQFTMWQVRRAAWLIHRMLDYRADLESKAQSNPYAKDVPFQMPFYRCRVPMEQCDTLAGLPSRGSLESRKMVLMLRDWIYLIPVLDNADAAVPPAEIEKRIWAAIHDANLRQKRGESAVPVGVLTAHDRNTWAKARQHLLDLSPQNALALSAIERSIFIMSLDDYTRAPDSTEQSVDKDLDLDAHIKNASSGNAGHNRWFDKCVSMMVESSSRTAGMGEHSPCDGLVVGALFYHCLEENIDPQQFESNIDHGGVSSEPSRELERVEWVVDDWIIARCLEAEEQVRQISDDSDASMLCFEDYGTEWVKEMAKLAPDAYAQMAMQLAWHKAQGDFTATYETATTRMYIYGRTETIRSFSTESYSFVKAMTDPQCSDAMRLQRLQEAIKAHNSYTRDAIKGRGVDRHFLGLRLLMKEGESARLFQDPLFARSEKWRLSTSGLYQGEKFTGTGFGSPYWDGYGVQYLLHTDRMKFGVESKRSCETTSTEGFKMALVASLREMRKLCEAKINKESRAHL